MDLYNQIEASGALFNVRKEALMTESGILIKDRVSIVNEATNKSVGLVSPTYRVVTNGEVAEHMCEALNKSGIDLTDATAEVQSGYGGARTMLNIRLPSIDVNMGGDVTQLQISALNSYDGRWKYITKGGGIRLACMNGQIMGHIIGSYVEYHNKKLDVQAGAVHMIDMVNDFSKSEEWFMRMMNTKIDREQLLRSIAIFVEGTSKIDDREAFLKKPTVNKLVDLYDTYSLEMGKTAYALYNALTDFVSHKKRNEKTKAVSLFNEQERLRTAITKVKVFA